MPSSPSFDTNGSFVSLTFVAVFIASGVIVSKIPANQRWLAG
jgi:hypothetical protein